MTQLYDKKGEKSLIGSASDPSFYREKGNQRNKRAE